MKLADRIRTRSKQRNSAPTDDELMREVQAGSREAYLEIYDRYEGQVFAYCIRVLNDKDRAADVFQESFVRVWERCRAYRGGNFGAWLFTIVRNLCRDEHKHQARQEQLEHVEGLAASEQGLDPLERDALAEALGRLTEDLREAIVLREYQGFSYQEIAELTGQTLSSVGVRIFRAKQQLRVLLAPVWKGSQ